MISSDKRTSKIFQDESQIEKITLERDQLRQAINKLAQLRRDEVENQKYVKSQIEENSEKLKNYNLIILENKKIREEYQTISNTLKKV